MKVCLLGGFGYLGSQIIHDLPRSYEIVVFDNLFWGQYDVIKHLTPKVRWYNESVLDFSDNLKREVSTSDIVVGLSALVGAPLCDKFPELCIKTNQEFYFRIVEYIKGKLFFMNTNSMYGSTNEVCTEKTRGNPISLYAKTKQAAEDFLIQYPFTISFRLATLYGVSAGRNRVDLLVNSLVLQALRKGYIEVFDGDFVRNYIAVKDVSRAILFGIENLDYGIYNLGNDAENCTKRELVKRIISFVDGEFIEVNNKTDPDKRNYRVSSELIKSKGFKCIYSLDTEIPKLIEFYKSNPNIDNDPVYRNY